MKYPIEVFKQTKQSTIYILVFLTNKCNYKCWYCYNEKAESFNYIDVLQLTKFLIEFNKKYDCHLDLNIIGGEPTLHPNLYDFLCNCKQYLTNYSSYIITNLSKPYSFFEKFEGLNCRITASYHSEYSFANFYNNAKILSERTNLIKDIIVMCNPYKFAESIDAYNKLHKLSLHTKNKFKVELDMVDNFKYSSSLLNEIRKNLKNKLEYTVVYSDKTTAKKSFIDIANNPEFNFKMWQCNAGKDILYIHNDGNIYPCESWFDEKYKPLGHISQLDFTLQSKPLICKCNLCSGDFNIHKRKIFSKI